MPVYNEQEAILLATADVQRKVLDAVPGAELLVVNDGSRDDSGRLLDEIAAKDRRIKVIHQENRGHGGALMTALSSARGDYVLLIDSDRQISLDSFLSVWAEIERGHDCVLGVRRQRNDPLIRLCLTRLVRISLRLLFGIYIFDANAPYKLMRRSIWDEARQYIPPDTLAPSLLLAVFVKLRGYDVVEVDVLHRERCTGEVSIRRLKLLKFAANGFRQLMAFRKCMLNVRC